jgi:hypothetical protein
MAHNVPGLPNVSPVVQTELPASLQTPKPVSTPSTAVAPTMKPSSKNILSAVGS